jgi:lipid A ethanolaminephosphotransferase
MKTTINQQQLILIVAISLTAFYNGTFFSKLLGVYLLTGQNVWFVCSVFILLVAASGTLFSFFSSKYTTKPMLILIVLLSSFASYFMDSYGAMIDVTMLQNLFETDVHEASDLFSFKLLVYFFLLGVIPAVLIYKAKIIYRSFARELINRVIFLICSISVIAASLFTFSASYASFIRENKPVRYYANPLSYIYAAGKYVDEEVSFGEAQAFESLGEDALIPASDTDRELIVMVVGETARADRFSLNGYERKTNPLLEKEAVISFSDFYSCGTSTAISVRCMFSFLNQKEFTKVKANAADNVLDVLTRAGVSVLWRDNNSNSKNVADRVTYQNFMAPGTNPDCDLECRDTGMLVGLQDYIDSVKKGDILIVLHQMGNHGPAYFKRYPETFEVFTPTCLSNQLETCSAEEINNTYDNVIVYTDYFLAKIIGLLKENSPAFEAAMFYVSDHGESLGESGIYLHGLPYSLAPKEQKHVPALMWFGEGMDIDMSPVKAKQDQRLSHDYVSHTLLGLMELESEVYNKSLDILSASK